MKRNITALIFTVLFCTSGGYLHAQELFTAPDSTTTGWSTFENLDALRGQGAMTNKGAKGQPADEIKPSESRTLFITQGAGVIKRFWITLSNRSPKMLRSIRLDFYWDNETKPAISVPLGDFFGVGLGQTASYQNALFASPEGRSFNCYIPMPFRKAAKIVFTNESDQSEVLFYDIDFVRVKSLPAGAMYLHAYWTNNSHTKLGDDFEILPKVTGKGRYLGSNLGIITNTSYGDSWWGEGEVKAFLDGDNQHPSLVGTGTEDYIGDGWGQSTFTELYQGCTIADAAKGEWAFYRYHIPDPVYFNKECRVTIGQMGNDVTDNVKKYYKAGANLEPVSVSGPNVFMKLLDMQNPPKLTDPDFPNGYVVFYRLDNYSSIVYFYLDKPSDNLPPLAPLAECIRGIN